MKTMAMVLAMAMAGVAAVAGSGPAAAKANRAKMESEAKAQVQAELRSFVAAVDSVNAGKAFAFFSSSPQFVAADNGSLFTSRDAMLAAYRKVYAELKSQDRKLADEHITVLSPGLVMVTVGGTFSLTYKSGKVTPPAPIAWTLLWRREGKGWKVINAHESFVAPVAAP